MDTPVTENLQDRGQEILPPALRLTGNFLSVIFHPLLIPLYVTLFLLYIHPAIFNGFSPDQKIRIAGTVIVNLVLLPAVTVFLIWRLGFSQSIFLRTQRERIIPYAAMMFYSFWCWNVFRNLQFSPPEFNSFLLGVFIAVIMGWLTNIYFKTSMHALGVGGMLYFIIAVSFGGEGSSGQYIAAAIIITGLTCSARFISSDHTNREIYGGLLLGALAQAGGQWFT